MQDRNDNDPVFQRKIYEAAALETDPPGTSVLTILALDKDENSRWAIFSFDGCFFAKFRAFFFVHKKNMYDIFKYKRNCNNILSRVHYEITAGNTRNRFSISTQNTQGVLSIAQPLDYQQEKRFLLTISATDSGGRLV